MWSRDMLRCFLCSRVGRRNKKWAGHMQISVVVCTVQGLPVNRVPMEGRLKRAGSTNGGSSDLFICFPSRLSSSSSSVKRISSSGPIHSPGRARDPPIYRSTSLSRRRRAGVGVQPFPDGGKKRGCAFDHAPPEPSSPKVTCIGQVRVKSKKKKRVKSFRTLSTKKQGDEGQSLNRNLDQRRVHLPLTICEALRAFEFSCLFPCQTWCYSVKKEEKMEVGSSEGADNDQNNASGPVLARWLVTLQDGGGGGGGGIREREIELVVGEDEDTTQFTELPIRKSRRHVFDDLEIVGDKVKSQNEEEEGRVSICIPPKNALLLMRCRSDPVQLEALASRLCNVAAPAEDEEDESECKEDDKANAEFDGKENCCEVELTEEEKNMFLIEYEDEEKDVEEGKDLEMEVKQSGDEENKVQENIKIKEEVVEEQQVDFEEEEEEEDMFISFLFFEEVADENVEIKGCSIENAEMETDSSSSAHSDRNGEMGIEAEGLLPAEEKHAEQIITQKRSDPVTETQEEKERERESGTVLERENRALPECLLLMMCEPKLSMEVSKETWVHSSDLIGQRRDKKIKPRDAGDEPDDKDTAGADPNLPIRQQQQQQQQRSSISIPSPAPAVSLAAMIEQRLINAVGYEPIVLTRCKSEPMRTAAAKLVPRETCFWKSRKLEPLRRAASGVGAAGLWV